MMIATMPKARLASQKTCWVGSAVMRVSAGPSGVALEVAGEQRARRRRGSALRRGGRGAAWPRSGPRSSAVLASVSASSAVGASAVAWITPVHAGVPRAGSMRWCA